MPDYQKLYHKMFNGVTDTIESLIKLQQDVEEEYLLSCGEDDKRRAKMKLIINKEVKTNNSNIDK